MEWHRLSPAATLSELESSESGITDAEARKRIAKDGRNELPKPEPDSIPRIFLRQFASPIIYILLVASAIVTLLGELTDAAIILAVLVINAIVGAVQEGRAQNTFAALQKMVRTNALVLRGGRETIIPSEELAAGDIVVIREGDKVPADARVIEAAGLKIDESALTGESTPIDKSPAAIDKPDLPSPDQRNMIFRGTYAVEGEARAVVVATGLRTVIGKISEKLESLDTDVPLKAEIKKLSRTIIIIVLSISALIFAIGLVRGNSFSDMFATAVAVAVSATPEGLPVVVTIVLAAGVYRMSRQNALVRRLQAVEALGQAQIIALDKTGTITLNQMAVEKIYVSGEIYDVAAQGYEPKGRITKDGGAIEPLDHPDLILFGKTAALSASATVAYSEEAKEWQRIAGDPTEAAILVLSQKIGFDKDSLEQEHKKILEAPFSSSTKYRAVMHETGGKTLLSAIGAPEAILERCSALWRNGKKERMSESDRESIERAVLGLSKQGLRLVALAQDTDSRTFVPGTLPELCFIGLAGISDSIRTDARESLEKANRAGVKIVMITGDYPETAKAIGAKVGIYRDGDGVVTGKDLATLSSSELSNRLSKTTIFARVVPDDKLKIIEAYRKEGLVVAMTGDGVNDALPLAAADLGVAMGKIGTEVAKEASDIVLLDDNFGSIVSAIEEGRNVYRSIKKVILYLFSTSMGEILTITAAMLLGFPIPLLPSQILWMNFVTDGFLVVALGLEPKGSKLLSQSSRKERLIDRLMALRTSLISAAMTASALFLFISYLDQGFVKASTVALTTLAVCQWLNALNVRSEHGSIIRGGGFRNPFLLGAFAAVIGLQCLALYTEPLQKLLHTVPLRFEDWAVIVGMSLSVVLVEEIRKAYSSFSKRIIR